MEDCTAGTVMEACLTALANCVKSARKENGLTQEQLAALIGVDTRTIMNIENCNDMNPKLETLVSIFQFFKLDTNEVFYPSLQGKTPAITELEVVLDGCSEEEILALIPICRCILNSIRSLQKVSAI